MLVSLSCLGSKQSGLLINQLGCLGIPPFISWDFVHDVSYNVMLYEELEQERGRAGKLQGRHPPR